MSNRRDSDGFDAQSVAERVEQYYHYPVLFALVLFAFVNRVINWSDYVVDGTYFFRGNDPYYHLTQTEYTVSHFPFTMPFDPGTYFPYGASTGQFGTLFDQVIAFGALVVGLGNPSNELVRRVFFFAPPFFIIPIIIVAYFIGRRLGGRFGGLVSAGVVAFAPDRLLQVSVVGSTQHEVAEPLLMGLGVLGIMVALTVAEREKPVYELVAAREFGALRNTIGWSMLAGVAIALYLWVWPPGVFLYGILGVFFVVHLSIEHIRGRSPEHASFVGVVALSTAGLLQLPFIQTLSLTATGRSPLQVGMALGVVAGIVFLAWLSRLVERRNLSPLVYPAAVAGSILVTLGVMALALPDLLGFFLDEVDRVLGFVTSPGTAAGTIGEAQPADLGDLQDSYKLAGYTAVAGAALLLVKQFFDEEPRGEQLLIVVWGVFILAATLTQMRFEYYMTLIVGGLNAALAGYILGLISPSERSLDIQSYQVFTITAILLLLFVPMVLFSPTAIAYADDTSRPGESAQWSGGLEWMEGNTPDPGLYGNPDGDQFDMDGTYKVTDDFDYPDGTYGVLSWWDYGHYITSDAKRIPTANPFQQGVRPAADFLLAQNESEAMDVLSEIDESDNAQAQYVMVDWKMVNTDAFRPVSGKFFAPPDFHDEFERSDFYTRVIDQQLAQDRGIISATSTMLHKQPYYNAMMTRLYKYHGSAQQPRPYVVEWQGAEQQLNEDETFVTSSGPSIQFYDSLRAAQQAVENSSSAQIGGFGPYPAERVPALEHFRLVHMSNLTALAGGEGFNFQRTVQNNRLGSRLVQQLPQYNGTSPQAAAQDFLYGTNPAWTKTFERVPGATIEGTGPANRSVLLSVELKPENGQQFTYTQSVDVGEDGQFNTTVPYATTGDDEYGVEEGYTNSTIEAQTPYRLSAPGVNDEGNQTFFIGEVNVTEGQVLGEESGPDPVELEPIGESDLIDTGDDGSDSESDDSGSEGTNSSSESESVDGTAGVQPQLTWTERQFAASAG